MTEIVKTKAVVISKIDYGDSSKIIQVYTEKFGKISAIAKGAKSNKSKSGKIIDILNYLEIILYKKNTRDVQIISEVELLSFFPSIKNDLSKYKYASAVLELIRSLLLEDEINERLFRGTIKILELIENRSHNTALFFAKYFLFFINELGYQISLNKCNECGQSLDDGENVKFSNENGIYCNTCGKDHLISFEFSKELFKILLCISSKDYNCNCSSKDIDKIIIFLEKYLIYHIPEFKGLKSLKMY